MTTTPGGTDGIFKMDGRGRLRVTRERSEELLAEFDSSAMSGRKYAEWAGINYTDAGQLAAKASPAAALVHPF